MTSLEFYVRYYYLNQPAQTTRSIEINDFQHHHSRLFSSKSWFLLFPLIKIAIKVIHFLNASNLDFLLQSSPFTPWEFNLDLLLSVVDWIVLAQDKYTWRALLNSVMKLLVL
jgi:hypothetical protein